MAVVDDFNKEDEHGKFHKNEVERKSKTQKL